MKKNNTLFLVTILMLASCSTQPKELEQSNESQESNTPSAYNSSETQSESQSEESSSINTEEKKKAKNITNYVLEGEDIPLFNVYTKNNNLIQSDEDYTEGHLSVVSQPDTTKIILEDAKMGIRLRGNSTLAAPKKAYRIKFDKKQSLFGLEKAKSWVLLANYFDKSNVRNYLAYLTANKLDNLDFQPSSIMVELKINDQYQGLYTLCEQMQTGAGRVDIEGKVDSKGNTSFFVESDDEQRLKDDGGVLNKTYVKADQTFFDVKYPEGEDLNDQAISFIREKLSACKSSLKNNNNIEKHIDIDSYIDAYFVQELFKNPDCNNLSLYYYYDTETELLKAGPVWDFDISLSAVGTNTDYSSYRSSTLWACYANDDYNALFKFKKDKIKARYKVVRSVLASALDELEIVKPYLEDAQERNLEKWSLPGDLSTWISARYEQEYQNIKTIEGHYEYIKTKLEAQLGYMDQEYL